jgi:nitrogen fixation NifU-like protein
MLVVANAMLLQLPPVKLHCSMLAEDAIKAAVKDLKTKQEEAAGAAGAKNDQTVGA